MSFYDFLDGINEQKEIESIVAESVKFEKELEAELSKVEHDIDKQLVEEKYLDSIFENADMKKLYVDLKKNYGKNYKVIMNPKSDIVGVFSPTLEPIVEVIPKGAKISVVVDGEKEKLVAPTLVKSLVDKAVKEH